MRRASQGGRMIGGLTAQQLLFFTILLAAFALLITERLRNDLVALLIIVALTTSGVLPAEEALSGFGSEPAVVVAAILVLSGGLHQTGLSESVGAWIGRTAGTGYTRTVAIMMPAVAVLSSVTHHVATTAVMLPVTLSLARDSNLAPSRLLMPLSFAASLGTAITIIGAPAFLIASGILQSTGRPGLSVFSIAPIGLALSAVGTLFMLTLGRWLLPDRGEVDPSAERFRLTDYFTELTVLDESPFVGKTVGEVEQLEGEGQLFVTGRLRQGHTQHGPFGDDPIQAGDVLLVRASPDELVAIREHNRMELHPVTQYQPDAPVSAKDADAETVEEKLVQAVVAPGSDLIGRSLRGLDFRRRYGAIVVGLWRQQGWLNEELAQVRLRAGDALVLLGDEAGLARVAGDRSFLLLMPFQGEARPRRKAPLAAIVMLASVLLATSGVVSLAIAMLSGAVAMVLTGCLRPRQAYRAIDTRIYVFIAGAIPLGKAMESSGASTALATWLQFAVGGLNPTVVLLVVFAIVAVVTQFMSDAATVALFGPVAATLAHALGRSPEAFVVVVAIAAVTAFLTPIGHHGNLLIYGPGRYQFADFVRVGAPLTILIGVVAVLMAQLLWPS